MPKTFTNLTAVATGDLLAATTHNNLLTTVNNHTVPPAVSVYFGTATTYTEGTSISWTAEDYDTDAMWTSGASITIQTAGVYVVTFTGRATSTVSASARAALTVSTSPRAQGQEQTTTDFRWSISLTRSFEAAATIAANVQWGGGGTITLQGNTDMRPTLTATFLGKTA